MAVGVAHDLNNLVTAISGYSELTLGLIPEDGPVRRHVAEVARAADRAASLTRQLLAFGRRRVLQPHPLDVGEVVDHIEDLLRRMLGEDIELRLQHDAKPALVFGDPAEIEQLIADAAISAREDLPRGGAFAITLRHAELDRPSPEEGLPAGSYVELRMEKVGPGRPTAEVDERWCASSIALARELARRRGGTARIGSTEADREGIAILLPSLSPSREPAGRDGQGPRGWETLLLVEDEADVRGLVREMLTSLGYDVVEAAGAQEALSVAEAHHGPIHLLLTDVVMPGMGGPELARRLTAVRPDIRVLMMSGYPDARLDEKDGLLGPTLRKPFSRRMLAVRVRDLIDGR
jgi:two-component system cell cycle sensor histidine kinase/response regulator CckA